MKGSFSVTVIMKVSQVERIPVCIFHKDILLQAIIPTGILL